jgi:hypothetical protein
VKPIVKPEDANICLMQFLLKMACNKGDALSQLLFHFALEYAIKKIQLNHIGLKLKEQLQSLI